MLETLTSKITDVLNYGEQNILESSIHIIQKILIEKALEHTHGRRIEAANQTDKIDAALDDCIAR
jgi:two-component system nitrogen regulation response regulator GlnG